MSNWSKLLNWRLNPSPPDCSKDSWKIIALVFIYQLANFGDLMSYGSKDIFKYAPCLFHHDVTDMVNQDMAKDTKIWVSWEWNVNFLWNKKILNIYLRWHISRNYCFVAEVIFRSQGYRVWCRSNQKFLPYSHYIKNQLN